jgi:hypothetical protein
MKRERTRCTADGTIPLNRASWMTRVATSAHRAVKTNPYINRFAGASPCAQAPGTGIPAGESRTSFQPFLSSRFKIGPAELSIRVHLRFN